MSSSLDLLNPKAWASRKTPWASETSKELEQASKLLIHFASARDWSNAIFERVTPDYHAEFDHAGGIPLESWNDYVAWQTRIAEDHPDYQFEVLDTCADVYENTGTGSVYMLLRVSGHPKNVVRESIIVMFWKKIKDEWRCEGQKVVRGMLWNA